MSKNEFIRKFMELFANSPDSTDPLKKIERDVDIEFVNALGQWIADQNDASPTRFTSGKVMSSLCYFIALEIAHTKFEEPDHLCEFVALYADYIHQAAHAIQRGEARDRTSGKNKS